MSIRGLFRIKDAGDIDASWQEWECLRREAVRMGRGEMACIFQPHRNADTRVIDRRVEQLKRVLAFLQEE